MKKVSLINIRKKELNKIGIDNFNDWVICSRSVYIGRA